MLPAMLGEADLLAGQVISPSSPPDALARLMNPLEDGESWVIPNMCAYVPQATWLQNATIKRIFCSISFSTSSGIKRR